MFNVVMSPLIDVDIGVPPCFVTIIIKTTKVVHFHKLRVKLTVIPKIIFNGTQIEVVSSVKCLGVVLYEFVNWDEYIGY